MKPLDVVVAMVEPPLPFGNAAGRWYYVLLKGLAARGHRVRAFASCRDIDQISEAESLFEGTGCELRCYPHAARRGLTSKLATLRAPQSHVFSAQMKCDLDRALARGFDVLHLEQLWSGWLGLEHAAQAVVNVHYLFDIDLAQREDVSLLERATTARAIQAGHKLLKSYPTISVLSLRLKGAVHRIAENARVHVIPLGMDTSLYPFEHGHSDEGPMVSLIGSFDWEPTYSAGLRLLKTLWPEIRNRVPQARLQLVGRSARKAFRGVQIPEGVRIEEDVPDTLPYFRRSTILLYAPVQGSGMKVKVMEAFALGVPVVTNEEGIEGLPAEDGVHAGIAESDKGLVDRTVSLLTDRSQRERIRVAARALIEAHCGPDAVLARVERMYSDIAGRSAQRRPEELGQVR